MSNVLQGIQTIVSEIDWQALQDATGNALAGLVSGLYGYPDWASLQLDFNNGFASLFGYDTAGAFENMRKDFEAGALAIGQPLVDWGKTIITWWTQLWKDFDTGANALGETLIRMYNTAAEWVAKIVSLINSIPTLGGILDINPGRNVTGGSTGGSSTGGGGGSHRASGGAVIAGQQYQVGEFFRPERFTPSTNGRVDPMQPAAATAGMGDDVFVQRFADVIARSLRSELQKSGRK